MPAHRVRRIAGATVLVLLAPLAALVLPQSAGAVSQTVPVTVDGTSTQTGRTVRDGVASECGTPKAFPGVTNEATTYNVATTSFVAPTSGCLTITRSNVVCPGGAANIHLSAYLGEYHRKQQDAHYLGDQGASNDDKVIGIDVEKGKTYVVVANNTAAAENCTLNVRFDLADDTTPPDTAFLKAPVKVRTSSAVLTFTGQPAADTAALQCQVDGSAFAACTSPLELEGLAVGTHTVAVRAVDDAGNADQTPASATFLSCDLAGATIALSAAKPGLIQAEKAVAKAKKALAAAKAKKAKKAKKKAVKALAGATTQAKLVRTQVVALEQGIAACAS